MLGCEPYFENVLCLEMEMKLCINISVKFSCVNVFDVGRCATFRNLVDALKDDKNAENEQFLVMIGFDTAENGRGIPSRPL